MTVTKAMSARLAIAALTAIALSGCVTAAPPPAPTPVVVQTPAPAAAPSVVVTPRSY